jgi:hypothetical protein
MERRPSAASRVGIILLLIVLSVAPAFSADVRLAWDPNSEDDLNGYGVYFNSGNFGPPYNLAGYVEVAELADPDSPSFVVTGLTTGARYSFAVTAYDTDGNESYYSSPVCVEVGVGQIQCSSLDASSSTSSGGGSGGGGGGGGCFIASAAAASGASPWAGVASAFSSVVLLGLNSKFRK